MAENTQKKKKKVFPTLLAYIAVATGMLAFMKASMKGHRVGWEEMSLYTGPSVVCALLAISMQRDKDSYAALVFAAASIYAFFQGA